jgi:hypothetical protein
MTKKRGNSNKYGLWPWKVPKWQWFSAKVAVNPLQDLATLLCFYVLKKRTASVFSI